MKTTARIENIRDVLMPLIEGKRLLDIGCIGHDFEARQTLGTFYIDDFRKAAAFAKGIDILAADVERAKRQGFPVEVADAETFVDQQKYDVVFAGELIEHLSNPGAFLRCAALNLEDDGVLVLTTPNAFSFSRIFRCITHATNEPPLNAEHTCYFTPQTMNQLISRWGFRLTHLYYSDYDYGAISMSKQKRLLLGLNRAICTMLPRFSQSFIVELRKAGTAAARA